MPSTSGFLPETRFGGLYREYYQNGLESEIDSVLSCWGFGLEGPDLAGGRAQGGKECCREGLRMWERRGREGQGDLVSRLIIPITHIILQ